VFRSLGALITRQGGRHVLALAAAVQSWSKISTESVPDLTRELIR
jgi:hypothetical protein